MEAIWIGISIAVFVAILVVLIANRRRSHRLSTLTTLGMTNVVLGIVVGDDRLVGYSLIGAGVVLALIEAKYLRTRRQL